MKYVSVSEMVAIEKEANSIGLSYDLMMANAGRGLAEVILDEFSHLKDQGTIGLVGSGNNGGDTLVALSLLAERGWYTTAYIVRSRSKVDSLVQQYSDTGGTVIDISNDKQLDQLSALIENNSIILDGVLGTGIKLPLKSELAEIFTFVNSLISGKVRKTVVVAVDCPSGIDCDSGEAAAECIPADLTVTMAAYKQGLLKFPAFHFVGDLRLVGIGLPEDGESLNSWRSINIFVPDEYKVASLLPTRPRDAHKGTFGTSMIIAGSINYTGAALLAGLAAYRIGSGLVTLAVPAGIHISLAGQFPEATWLPLSEEDGGISHKAAEFLLGNLDRTTALLIGPGFGLRETTAQFIQRFFTSFYNPDMGNLGNGSSRLPPVVIDADGLKLLCRTNAWWKMIPPYSVLTPHPGEMSILTGLKVSEIQSNRVAVAQRFSEQWEQIVVLKGAFTVIASPDKRTAVLPFASPALARAGTGDVLAGIIVGLLSQGLDPFNSAVSGAWIHAQAGLLAEKILGNPASVIAGDLLDALAQVLTLTTQNKTKHPI